MRGIKPGVTDGGMTEVTGINAGELLANSSFEKLQDNAKVVESGSKPVPGNTPRSAAP
jgi:multidrug efflux system membrane fusion protein